MGILSGKVAAVTGSTSGIGLAIAQALAADGADIALNGFGDAAAIEAMRAAIAADHGVRCIHLASDMSTGAGAAGFVQQVAAELGSVDILVNNVGIQHVAPVDEFPPEKWDALIAIILGSTFHTTRTAVPGMKAKGWGRIINVRTPLVEGQVADQAKVHNMSEDEVIRNVILAVQPTKRFVETGEIGAFAAFLASDAARSITGAALSVDGGWTTR